MLDVKTRYGAKLSKTAFILFMLSANKHRIRKMIPITITIILRLTFGINRQVNSTMAVNTMIIPANKLVRPKVR